MIYPLKRHKTVMFKFLFIVLVLAIFFLIFKLFSYYTKRISRFNNSEYVVLILSNPDGIVERMTIRDTWMKLASNIYKENGKLVYKWRGESELSSKSVLDETKSNNNGIVFLFAIGVKNLNVELLQKLQYEDYKFEDLLLLENIEDKYEFLALKMLKAISWLSENMKNLKYMIKCDDDSFVRVDLIVKDLIENGTNMDTQRFKSFATLKSRTATQPHSGLYWGSFVKLAPVYRFGKWAESEWFLCTSYLPYALGGGYVVSRSVVDYVALNRHILSLYMCEDVTMGVWTAPLEVRRVHDPRFESGQSSRLCDGAVLVLHKQASADLREAYSRLLHSNGRRLCADRYV